MKAKAEFLCPQCPCKGSVPLLPVSLQRQRSFAPSVPAKAAFLCPQCPCKGSVPLPPVSLQRQSSFAPSVPAKAAGCLLAVTAGVHMCSSLLCFLVGVKIKVMLLQPLTCDSSFMLPTCFPYSPPRSPTDIYKVNHSNNNEKNPTQSSFSYTSNNNNEKNPTQSSFSSLLR